jgi:hypothetical protein
MWARVTYREELIIDRAENPDILPRNIDMSECPDFEVLYGARINERVVDIHVYASNCL